MRARRNRKNEWAARWSAVAVGLVLAISGMTAQAVPITGSINFSGGATVNGTGLADATAFTGFSGLNVVGGSATDDYTPLNGGGNFGGNISFSPFSFGSDVLSPNPVLLWTVTAGGVTYSFEALSVQIVTQNANFLDLTGTGTAYITGGSTTYDPTAGTWSIRNTGSGTEVSFGANTASDVAVPDGGTTAVLFGAAFAGLVWLSRKESLIPCHIRSNSRR